MNSFPATQRVARETHRASNPAARGGRWTGSRVDELTVGSNGWLGALDQEVYEHRVLAEGHQKHHEGLIADAIV